MYRLVVHNPIGNYSPKLNPISLHTASYWSVHYTQPTMHQQLTSDSYNCLASRIFIRIRYYFKLLLLLAANLPA